MNIDILKEKISSEDYSSSNCSIDVVDKSGIIKSQFTFKGFPYKLETTNLPDGLYFIIIQMKNTKSTLRVTIKH